MRSIVGGVTLTAGALSVLALSSWLDPDARGYGTHTQIGLPPCAFRSATGLPCPSCGLTTSFSLLWRGELEDALDANPIGFLFFALTVLSVPAGIALAWRRVGLAHLFYSRWFDRIGLALLLFWVISWVVRLAATGSVFDTEP